MPIEVVVVNASPIICLAKSGLLELFPALFRTVCIPGAVMREVAEAGADDPGARAAQEASWLKPVGAISIDPRVAGWDLGSGESEVISFALQDPSVAAVLDDREARRCALTLGCTLIGTAGILVLARREGRLPSLRAAFERMRQAGLWISDALVEELCRAVGE